MADSLVLTGVKDIKKHTGTEMLRLNPKRGGDSFQLKRWWIAGGNGTTYTTATVFDVTTGAGTVKLAIESNAECNIKIAHDGSFNFAFSGVNEVERAALYTNSYELIEHYVFPSMSGGKIMTVTPPGSATRPSGVSFSTATSVTGTAQVGETLTVTAAVYSGGNNVTGTNLILQVSDTGSGGWTFLEGNPGTASGASVTHVIPASEEGKYIRGSYQVTDDAGVNTSNSPSSSVIIAAESDDEVEVEVEEEI